MAVHLATLPLAWSIACTRSPPAEWEPLALRASAWFHREDLKDVRLIGARFLARLPTDRDALQAELGPTLKLLKAAPPAEKPTAVEAAIAGDFEVLEVRDVEGWTLAATEAHLAALVELFGITA
jgi:hypothetical protein